MEQPQILEAKLSAAALPSGWNDTPKEKQIRTLLSGTLEDQRLAQRIYHSKLVKRIQREIGVRNIEYQDETTSN